jgi:uncharacterized membrane protein (DUF373 family)
VETIAAIGKWWSDRKPYARFEQIVSGIVMLLVAIVIIYSIILIVITLFNQIAYDRAFTDITALKDVFGSILTVLILIEFNHSIAMSLRRKSVVLLARYIVLITIMVVARKVILLDFSSASFESFIGIGAIALGMGLLYWLIGAGLRSPEEEALSEGTGEAEMPRADSAR